MQSVSRVAACQGLRLADSVLAPLIASPTVPFQGDCQTREEAVALGVGLCNNGFMHHGKRGAQNFA